MRASLVYMGEILIGIIRLTCGRIIIELRNRVRMTWQKTLDCKLNEEGNLQMEKESLPL